MAQQPPFFHGDRLAFWPCNQHRYRIYVLPEELLFLRMGRAGGRSPTRRGGSIKPTWTNCAG